MALCYFGVKKLLFILPRSLQQSVEMPGFLIEKTVCCRNLYVTTLLYTVVGFN